MQMKNCFRSNSASNFDTCDLVDKNRKLIKKGKNNNRMNDATTTNRFITIKLKYQSIHKLSLCEQFDCRIDSISIKTEVVKIYYPVCYPMQFGCKILIKLFKI